MQLKLFFCYPEIFTHLTEYFSQGDILRRRPKSGELFLNGGRFFTALSPLAGENSENASTYPLNEVKQE